MSDVSAIIDIFKMEQISAKKRAEIIIRLGYAINGSMGMNVTESLVWELVEVLDPENNIFRDEHYARHYYGFCGTAFVCAITLLIMSGSYKDYNGIARVNCMF